MGRYEVEVSSDGLPIALPPDWLVEMLTTKKRHTQHRVSGSAQMRSESNFLKGVEYPGRNDAIARAVGKLIGQRYTRPTVEEKILQMADECNPPMHHDEALRIVDSIYRGHAERHPEWIDPEQDPTESQNCTDMGNALRMAAQFGARIRFCKQLGWMVFDGKRWVPDDHMQIQGFGKVTVHRDPPGLC